MSRKRVIKNSGNRVDLESLFDEFQIKNRVRNLSSATVRGYGDGYDRFAGAMGHDLSADDITGKQIDLFTLKLMDDGLRPASINHYLRSMRAFLYWCMDEGYVDRFKIKLVKEQESVKETYSVDEIRVLVHEPLRSAGYVEWRCWAMACWFLGTGNRAETVCSIRLEDISFDQKEIHINRTKNRYAMVLPLSDELAQVLRRYIAQYRDMDVPGSYLFPNVGDEKLTVNALKISMRRYNRSRGVNTTGLHAFRHTFAKNWIRNTGDVFRLQKILGHKTLEMTRRYVNMFSEDLKQDYEKFSPLDRIKGSGNATRRVTPSPKPPRR